MMYLTLLVTKVSMTMLICASEVFFLATVVAAKNVPGVGAPATFIVNLRCNMTIEFLIDRHKPKNDQALT